MKKEASLFETQLYWLWHTWWLSGSRGILSHPPKFEPFPEARPNKASGKGPCSGTVGRRSAASLKNNRKHMWRAQYREGWRVCRAARNQDPRIETPPDPAGSHWHFLIRYNRAEVRPEGRAADVSAELSYRKRPGQSERKTWWMFLSYLWRCHAYTADKHSFNA